MIRRPPRSTLFPTRRSSDLCLAPRKQRLEGRLRRPDAERTRGQGPRRGGSGARPGRRSEEHTSELQSRQYLVCRLLLEKKKKKLLTFITLYYYSSNMNIAEY